MKEKGLCLNFMFALCLLTFFTGKLNAQEPTPHLYSISVKQSFTSWGNCSSDPDYEYADIDLFFGGSSIEQKHIDSDSLNTTLHFNHIFKNEQQNKDFSTLEDEYGHPISEITVHTHVSDIKNDKDLYYEFELAELVIGKNEESHEASDPCNNVVSSNREGYTMTTEVYIDDPIYMTYTGDYNYVLDYEILTIQVDNYYENGHATKPVLQVALDDGTNNWGTLENVIIKPESTIYLPYETVAGKKSVTTSHFYEWMGKNLKFRIVKTLKNGKKTTGNIISGIKFYPEGLQYTILQTRRSYCTNDISIYVKLENSDDQGYLDLNPNLFFWQATTGNDLYNCKMEETDEPSKYKLILKDNNDGTIVVPDPFDEPNPDPVEWTLQLIDMGNSDADACERIFTIPGKPDAISIAQKPPVYNINGKDYHIPSMNDPYVMLEINDPYEFSYLRSPYKIADGSDTLVTITDLPKTYDELTQPERDAIDAEFNAHFIEYTDLKINPNSAYKAYFYLRYKQWMDSQNATSPEYRILHPLGTYEYYASLYHSHEHTHTCTHTHSHTHTCMDEHPGGGYIGCTTSHEVSATTDLCSTSHTHITDNTRPYSMVHSHSHTHTRTHTHIHTHTGDHAHGEDPQYNFGVIKKYNTSTHVTTNESTTVLNMVTNASLVRDGFKTEYIIRSDGNNIPTTIWTEDDILNNVYPNQGVALEWYNDYKVLYKVKWLYKRLGVKVNTGILVNQNQDLTLIDGDRCEYPFTIHVKAPPNASFTKTILTNPSDACAKNGRVRITYNGGGVPPYAHSAGTLSNIGNQIIVDGLGYGENTIYFNDGAGQESASITVSIGSATRGITSTPALPQTCSLANGSITVNIGSVPGSKTYTLTNENTYEKYVHTTSANSSTFNGLTAGSYMAEVESGTCYFSETGINVASQVFGITTPIPTDATVIDGTGSISMSFVNRTNNVTWVSGVPTVFNTSENANNIGYSGVESNTYNFIARHVDDDSRTCDILGSFEVKEPSFTAIINIEETDNNATISVSLTDGNSLITPYHFRLFNSSGSEIFTGDINSSFSALVQNDDTYTLNLVYGSNNIDIYTFNYPSGTIINGHSIIAPVCLGGNGSVTLNPSGGIDGNNFTISIDGITYNTTKTFTIKGGDFKYYLKDENTSYFDVSGNDITLNHSLVNSFTVLIPEPSQVAANVIPIDVTCAGSNNGKVSIDNLSGGSGTYQYRVDNRSWTDPQTETPSLTPGNHVVYLQDSYNDCPVVTLTNFYISEPDPLNIDSLRIVQPTCELANGEIYVEAEGGNGLFQFDWTYNGNPFCSNNNPAEDSITHLGDSLKYGFYGLTITDNNNCTYTRNIELNEYFNPQITNTDITDVRCYGENNGEIKINEITGTNPFNKIVLRGLDFIYKDSIYTIADSFNSLPKGRYELEAIDDSACVSSLPYSITVNQPDTILYAIIDTIVPVLQKGMKTGRIYSTVYGGNDGLKTLTLLDSDNITIDQQFERNQFPAHFDSLYAGNYSLNIIDRKGCTYNLPIQTVSEPQTALGFNVVQKKDAMCKAQTGNFTVEGFGGWGGYSYKRAKENGYYKINSFKNLYAGSYIVSVSDKYGAVFTDTVVIYEPKDSLQARLINFSEPTCNENGSLSLNINGGIAPYKLFFEKSSDTVLIAAPQDYIISNRPVGSFLMHVTDSNGCKFELETGLSDQDLIDIVNFELTYTSTEVSNDGTIKAFVRGGKSPLNFAWRELFGSTLAETSAILSNVSSGHYELTVSEQDGCSKTKRVYLPAVTDMAIEIIELKDETSYQAQNGSAQLHTNLESLLNAEIVDPDGIRTIYNMNDSTAQFYKKNHNLYLRNLKGGSYFVMATNNLGEKAYAEFDIKPYDQFYFEDIQISHLKEMNDSSGTIKVVVVGGAGKNRFVWEYLDGSVDQKDTINSEFTTVLENAVAGNYQISVTDKYNNSISQIITIDQPTTPLEITISEFRNESCKDYEDAYAIAQASGGWGDYQFRQDSVKYYSNDDTWTNLDVREHYFYLTDKMGAIDSIAVQIKEPDYLEANVEFVDSVNCKSDNNGNILFNITGGTAPYRFLMQTPSGIWIQDTVARNLAEGDYSFIFTDNNNCIGQDTVIAYMPEPDSLLFDYIDVTHTTCNTNNGAIKVDMQGGTSPYRYEWKDFSGNTLSNENTLSGLHQNTRYSLHVLDAHNCWQQYEQLIKPSTNPIILDIDTTQVLCHGGSTGTAHIVDVTPAQPFAPYSFTWSNADTGEYSDGYKAGIHSVSIADTNNCSTVKYFEITQPDTLRLVVTDFKDAHCYGYNDGFIETQASGGVGSYQFNWTNGETTPRIESLNKGTYGVLIIDANLCSIQDTFEIFEPDELIVDLGDDLRICPGNSINIDGQNFTTYQWSNSSGVFSNERFISVDTEDNYYLEVTDSIGCFAHDEILITVGNDALQADFLMSSLANVGDTLFIYEISNIELDSLQWDYNLDAFNNIPDNTIPNYMLQLETNQLGIFNVELWAYSGGCISIVIKQVEVIQSNDTINDNNGIGYTDPLISELSVYPNPTDGNFAVKVVLREISDIQINLFSVNQGVIIDQRKDYGQDYYEIEYRLNGLNTGVYVIVVTAKNESKQIKIIVE